jgi:cobalt-zinc-cadmium efflux system outer membrane protein
MMRISRAALAVALLSPRAVLGTVLTLGDALERARQGAPAIVAARLRPDEARGRLAGASVLLRDNPVVDAVAGRRKTGGEVSTDLETGVTQTFELGGQRRSRIAGARAEIESRSAEAANAVREALRQVAASFLRVLAAQDRLQVLRANEEIARSLLDTSERRHRAGDIADLELNLARVAASRAHADARVAAAARELARSELKVALGIDANEPLDVRGNLRERPAHALDELLTAAADRADLRALAAEVREAEAEARLGERSRWPDLGSRTASARSTR